MMLPFTCYLFDSNLSLADVDFMRAHYEQLTNQELFQSVDKLIRFHSLLPKPCSRLTLLFKDIEEFQSTQVKTLSN